MREREPRLREDDEKRRGDDERNCEDDEKRREDDERNRGDDNQQDTRTRRLQAGGRFPPPPNQSVIPFGHYFCKFIPAGLEFY